MTTDEKSLIEDLSRRAHFEWLYSRVAEDWKYGGTEDTSKKIHPRIRVYDNLPETVKADYRGVINETFNALRRCGARIQSLDVLESLYFIAACNTSPVSAHVATLFLQHDAVDQALLLYTLLTVIISRAISRAPRSRRCCWGCWAVTFPARISTLSTSVRTLA